MQDLNTILDSGLKEVTYISLALTPATIFICLLVVCVWWKAAKRAVSHGSRTDIDWFVIGVMASFLGSTVDNLYWGFAWLAEYYHHPAKEALFKYGSYSNTFFRQGCTLAAAYCHLHAATLSSSISFKLVIGSIWMITILTGVTLALSY